MPYLELKTGTPVVRITGSLEMAYADQEDRDAKYSEMDLIVAGSSTQIELLMNRLNNCFDGGVKTEKIPLSEPLPNRPTRELARGDWVEWWDTDGDHHEGMFLRMDTNTDHATVRVKKDKALNVPIARLHYVDDAGISQGSVRRFKQGDRVRWTRTGEEHRGIFDYMRTITTANVLEGDKTVEVWLGDLSLDTDLRVDTNGGT